VLSAVLELRVEEVLLVLPVPVLVALPDDIEAIEEIVEVKLGIMLVNGVSARLDPDMAGA